MKIQLNSVTMAGLAELKNSPKLNQHLINPHKTHRKQITKYTETMRYKQFVFTILMQRPWLLREATRKSFFLGRTTKRGGGGQPAGDKGRTTKKKDLFLELEKKFRKNVTPRLEEGGGVGP